MIRLVYTKIWTVWEYEGKWVEVAVLSLQPRTRDNRAGHQSTGNTAQAIPNAQNPVGSVLEKNLQVKQIFNFPSQDHTSTTEE